MPPSTGPKKRSRSNEEGETVRGSACQCGSKRATVLADVPCGFNTQVEAQEVLRRTHDAFAAEHALRKEASNGGGATENLGASNNSDDMTLWLAISDEASTRNVLRAYAEAQHHLASTLWQEKEVDYIIDAIESYYRFTRDMHGMSTSTSAYHCKNTVPGAPETQSQQAKCDTCWAAQGLLKRALAAVYSRVDDQSTERTEGGEPHQSSTSSGRELISPDLYSGLVRLFNTPWTFSANDSSRRCRVLDVGSCYNPLASHPKASRLPLDIVATDLHPPAGSHHNVLKGDWLQLEVCEDVIDLTTITEPISSPWWRRPWCSTAPASQSPGVEETSGTNKGKQEGEERSKGPVEEGSESAALASLRQLSAVQRCSVDVVVMSYLLSFLPSPQLRLLACEKAAEVLRPGGILVIVEARRGGHRAGGWPARWTQALEQLGPELTLRRVRMQYMKKSVGLVFAKQPALLRDVPASVASFVNTIGGGSSMCAGNEEHDSRRVACCIEAVKDVLVRPVNGIAPPFHAAGISCDLTSSGRTVANNLQSLPDGQRAAVVLSESELQCSMTF